MAAATVVVSACGGGATTVITEPAAQVLTSAECSRKWSQPGSDIVLLIGQSNMAGYGAYYVEGFDKTDTRINQWMRAGKVELAREPLDHPNYQFDTIRIGPGLSFARAYLTSVPTNRNILLVPAAEGDTGFSNSRWNPGNDMFEAAVARTNAALALNPGGNCIAAILWSQGETDAINGMSGANYRNALHTMIGTLRQRISGGVASTDIPFVLGQFSPDWAGTPTPAQAAILDVINSTPQSVARTAIASTAGLTSNLTQGLSGGAVHLDAASHRLYGPRFRESLRTAVANAGPR